MPHKPLGQIPCQQIQLGRNVFNCSSMVDSILDAHDQSVWIGEHVMDGWDLQLVQQMQDLCEPHAAYSKGIVLGINHGLGCRLLYSRSPVNRSSEGDVQTTSWFTIIRASSIVRINVSSKCAFSFSSECSSGTRTPIISAAEVSKHVLQSYHMLDSQIVIILAGNSDGICNIGTSGGYCVHLATDHQLVYGQIAGFFVRLALVKLHRYWHGNWCGLIHSQHRQDRPNVAVLKNVDRVQLPIALDVHLEIEGGTSEIMHPEPPLHLILDVPNQALVSNDKEIINEQNDHGNYVLIQIMEHELSSINTWCYKLSLDHEVLISAIPNVQRLFQAIKRLSQVEYHHPQSLWSWIVVSAPRLDQTKISLQPVHIDFFLQVNYQESDAYVHLMDIEIVLGGNRECQPDLAQASSRCIDRLVVDAFDLVISSTD